MATDYDAPRVTTESDADLTNEELTVRVVPKQADEFVCSSCFLVQHSSRLALRKDGQQICTECV